MCVCGLVISVTDGSQYILYIFNYILTSIIIDIKQQHTKVFFCARYSTDTNIEKRGSNNSSVLAGFGARIYVCYI